MSPAAAASARLRVTLPGGLWRDRVHLRRATLRPITGADEEALIEAAGEPPAVRASLLLGRCLLALEAEETGDETGGDAGDAGGHRMSAVPAGGGGLGTAAARRLTVGDREALLLHLRRHTFGDLLDALLHCPRPECGEPMDLALDARELLLPPYPEPRPEHETTVETGAGDEPGNAGPWTLRFRLPTGADQEEAAARLEADGAAAAVDLLAGRCLIASAGPGGGSVAAGAEPAGVHAALAAAIADADPQAELILRLTCPECGEPFSSRFDAAAYLLAELTADPGSLYRQLHALALHYHWSEAEILALTPHKRRLYLGLLADRAGAPAVGGGEWRPGAVA